MLAGTLPQSFCADFEITVITGLGLITGKIYVFILKNEIHLCRTSVIFMRQATLGPTTGKIKVVIVKTRSTIVEHRMSS